MPAANTPTITLTDNADGTGAVATISGSTSGSTNTIRAASWSAGFVGQVYTSYGSRTGDGTVALALGLGYWFVECLSTKSGLDGARSLVVGCRVTDGEDADFQKCLDALVAKFKALSLPSPWSSANITSRKYPWNRGFLTDAIDGAVFVTPLNDRITPAQNESDDWGLAVQVTAAQKSNEDLTTGLSADLLCRQQLINAVLPRPGQAALPGVDNVYDLRIEPGPVIDEGAFKENYDVGAFVVRCIARRTRTLT